MPLTQESVVSALGAVVDPEHGKTLSELGMLQDVKVEGDAVTFTVDLGAGGTAKRDVLGAELKKVLASIGAKSVEVRWTGEIAGRMQRPNDPLPKVKNVVLVMSGKGGVGKSTCATNLALALKRAGHRVGLLDADIYGPSIPTMLGVGGRPVSLDGKTIEPLERFGVKLMSIGFLLEDAKQAVIWRGPMLTGALQQFLKDVNWGELDFLLMDLPPGTGDVALSISQMLGVSGAVIVTTPQPVATDDVFKSVSMCQKVNIPVLGVVENMSYFIDTAGVRHELFGKGGGEKVAEFAQAPLLGQIPIDQSVREWGDKGTPVVQAAPASSVAQAFQAVAERLADVIAQAQGGEDATAGEGPIIDRSGGPGGKKRLQIVR